MALDARSDGVAKRVVSSTIERMRRARTAAPCGIRSLRKPPIVLRGGLRELVALPVEDLSHIIRMPYGRFISQPRTEREIRAYAAARGYKPGWVWHRLQEQRSRGEQSG